MATTNYGWTELELDDEPNIGQVNVPLNQIDTTVKANATATVARTVASGAAVATANPGWSVVGGEAVKIAASGVATVTVVLRNSSTVAGVGLSNIGFIGVGWRPTTEVSLAFRGSANNSCTASLTAGGALWIYNLVSVGMNLDWRFTGTFFLP